MIHLDTGFLIRALVPGSPESEQMERWLGGGEPIRVSAVAWTEFLCGPVDESDVERALLLFDQPMPLTGAEATGAARSSGADLSAAARIARRSASDFETAHCRASRSSRPTVSGSRA